MLEVFLLEMERLLNKDATAPIVVMGSRPQSVLPAATPALLIAANGAVSRATECRRLQDVPLVAIAASGSIQDSKVSSLIRSAHPDFTVVVGDRIESIDEFAQTFLAVDPTKVLRVDSLERFRITVRISGLRGSICALRLDMRAIIAASRRLLVARSLEDWKPSTGLFATMLALILANTTNRRVIASGIGLEGGDHHYGEGSFSAGRAAVDARLVRAARRKGTLDRLSTTDRSMQAAARVPLEPGVSPWSG